MQLGKGQPTETGIGEIQGEPNILFQATDIESEKLAEVDQGIDQDKLLESAIKVIEANAELEDSNTNPGIVILDTQASLPRDLYWQAVREVVELDYIKTVLTQTRAVYKGYKNCRGLIGATAAISWAQAISINPKLDRTYEVLSYRERAKWGTAREIDEASVIEMDKKFGSTFDNYDYENRHINIAPNSPCPVLFGIRAESPEILPEAKNLINSETIDQWLIFETNQGTDDHLQSKPITELQPYQSVITECNIVAEPRTIGGGHVIFAIAEGTGNPQEKIDCAAYEPTKGFRELVKQFKPGDSVRIYGSIRAEPLTINLEKLEILRLVAQT
ncbi:MAG: DUF1743 domain-containing protein, partial [Thermoplasmata archaeon]|nr:DUF1743 domain-containing protein [Thermoplasmata archaeon]